MSVTDNTYKKLNSLSYKIKSLIGLLQRFNSERELSDVIKTGYTVSNKKALNHIKKGIKSCKYPYVESEEEFISEETATYIVVGTELWKTIQVEDLTTSESTYLKKIFQVYSLACTKYFDLIK